MPAPLLAGEYRVTTLQSLHLNLHHLLGGSHLALWSAYIFLMCPETEGKRLSCKLELCYWD